MTHLVFFLCFFLFVFGLGGFHPTGRNAILIVVRSGKEMERAGLAWAEVCCAWNWAVGGLGSAGHQGSLFNS